MFVRVLLAALVLGLGLHHVAPLMPGHTATATVEGTCTSGCDDGHGMGMASGAVMICMGALAVAAALPRIRRRLLSAGRGVPALAMPRALAAARVPGRSPPPPAPFPPQASVLRC